MAHQKRTTHKAVVDIGVSCYTMASYQFWSGLSGLLVSEALAGDITLGTTRAISSVLPDSNKNMVVGNAIKRLSLPDVNRTKVAEDFLSGTADYLFWLDDDIVTPKQTISRLMKMGREFSSGLYFLTKPPYHPIAYRKLDGNNGAYAPIYAYSEGAILQVDSVGMGCALVHRSVYEKIMEGHTLFNRWNGSLAVIENNKVFGTTPVKPEKEFEPFIRDGIFYEQYTPVEKNDERAFPFFQLEHGRGEDHFFCELAAHIGVKPWLDTSLTCTHYKLMGTTFDTYNKIIMEEEGLI